MSCGKRRLEDCEIRAGPGKGLQAALTKALESRQAAESARTRAQRARRRIHCARERVEALRAGNAVLRERVLAKQQVSDQIIWPFASALYET